MTEHNPAPETIRKLSSLESKMEYVIKTIDNIHEHVEKTNGRVSTLEKAWMFAKGVLFVITAIVGFLSMVILGLIG